MKYTIVLVEDEINLNNLIKTYLENAGYNVISFYNGTDAINNINVEAHLWILDIMLPDDINGYDKTGTLEESRRNQEKSGKFDAKENALEAAFFKKCEKQIKGYS